MEWWWETVCSTLIIRIHIVAAVFLLFNWLSRLIIGLKQRKSFERMFSLSWFFLKYIQRFERGQKSCRGTYRRREESLMWRKTIKRIPGDEELNFSHCRFKLLLKAIIWRFHVLMHLAGNHQHYLLINITQLPYSSNEGEESFISSGAVKEVIKSVMAT